MRAGRALGLQLRLVVVLGLLRLDLRGHVFQAVAHVLRHPHLRRQVTKAVDPKRQAVWTLGDLYSYFTLWAYDVYDTTPHPA